MQNLKIRVSQEQIGKVLDCFRQLGAKEYPTSFFKDEIILYLFYAPDLQRVEFSFREKNFVNDCGQEITLEELEQMAAEAQNNGLNSLFERSEAQARYEAAKAHITKATFGHISPDGEGWLSDALKIAAGLEH